MIRPPPIPTLFPYTTLFRSLQLRAERAQGGSGRVYTVTYTLTDQAGNTEMEEHTSELQSPVHLVCRLLLEKKKKKNKNNNYKKNKELKNTKDTIIKQSP